MSAWLLVNINRDTEKRREPFDLEEVTGWLGYAQSYVAPAPPVVAESPQTPDELKRRLEVVYQLHKLTSSPNGEEGR